MNDYEFPYNDDGEYLEGSDFESPELDDESDDYELAEKDSRDDSDEEKEDEGENDSSIFFPRFGVGTISSEEEIMTNGIFHQRKGDWLENPLGEEKEPDITELDINEIKACGRFTPEERAAEYRRRGKSPSGVIDGEYNDEYRGNDEYNDEYRDWDANA